MTLIVPVSFSILISLDLVPVFLELISRNHQKCEKIMYMHVAASISQLVQRNIKFNL